MKILLAVILLSVNAFAYDTSKNPDVMPSIGIDISKGKLPGVERADGRFTGGVLVWLIDYRVPVTNYLTFTGYGELSAVDNNLQFSNGSRVGVNMRIYLQNLK